MCFNGAAGIFFYTAFTRLKGSESLLSHLIDAPWYLVLYISNFSMASLHIDLNSRSSMNVLFSEQNDLV